MCIRDSLLLQAAVLLVVVVPADHADLVTGQVGGWACHGDEGLRAELSDSAQVADQTVLAHADARVLDGQAQGALRQVVLLDCGAFFGNRLPDVLPFTAVHADLAHRAANPVGGVVADAELANHGDEGPDAGRG
eukprot:5732558-Alexandrium_andersonii.AAC.1